MESDDPLFIAVVDLLNGQPQDVIKRMAKEEIAAYREKADDEQAMYDALIRDGKDPANDPAYISQRFATLAHKNALTVLLDVMAFSPDIGSGKAH